MLVFCLFVITLNDFHDLDISLRYVRNIVYFIDAHVHAQARAHVQTYTLTKLKKYFSRIPGSLKMRWDGC